MFILFHGENTYESWHALKKLTAGKSVQIVDGDEISDISEIMVKLDSLSLFAGETDLVLLKRFFSNRKTSLRDDFLVRLEQKNLRHLNLLMWEDRKVNTNLKLFKFLQKKGEVKEFKNLDAKAMIPWMAAYVKKLGLIASRDFLEKMLLKTGESQWMWIQEFAKLSLLLKSESRNKLESADLDFISINPEGNIWEFLDAVAGRKRKKILDLFQELLIQGNNVQYIITMLAKHLKTLFLVKQNLSGLELGEMGINPYVYRKAAYFGKNFTLPQIKLLFSKLVSLDYAIKQGKIEPVLGTNLFLATI